MKALVVAAVLVVLAAQAQASPDLLGLLDDDAPVVVRIDQGALAAVAARLDRLPWPYAAVISDLRGELEALVGADPTQWAALGLDARRPVVASLGAIDGAAALALAGRVGPWLLDPAATEASAGTSRPRATKASTLPPMWRSRIVLPVADPVLARGAVVRAFGAAWLRDHDDVARLIGARAGELGAAITALGKRRVFAIAPAPGGGLVLARTTAAGDVIVLDAVTPALHREVRWRDDHAAIDQILVGPARPLVVDGPWRALGRPGVVVAVDVRRLADAAAWRGLLEVAYDLADDIVLKGTVVDRTRAMCGAASTVIAGPIRRAAAALTIVDDALVIDADVGVAPKSVLAAILDSAGDQGLPGPASLPDAALVVRSLIREPSALAGLPAPAMIPGLPPMLNDECDPVVQPIAAALAWPYQLGELARRLAVVDPRARGLIAAAGNAVLAIGEVGDTVDETTAAFEVAIAPAITSTLDPIIDHVWGASTSHRSGAAIWGAGRVRAFRRELGTSARVGLAVQAPSLDWWLATPAVPAAKGVVLELAARPPMLAGLLPMPFGLVATAVPRLAITARRSGDGVHLVATIELR